MSNNEKDIEEKCDLPEVRDLFPNKCCSDEQIIKCHGKAALEKYKKEGKI